MSKSEKSAYFRHVLDNNFFVHFLKTFQRIRNQRKILRFLIPILNILITKFFFHLLALLLNFACKCTRNGSKKGKLFYKRVLEFN